MTESPKESSAADRKASGTDAGETEAPADAERAAAEPSDAATSNSGASAPSSGTESDDEDGNGGGGDDGNDDLDALREQVEATYDFEDFGPADMAEMSLEEWEAAFDPETWIVGEELLDRVEQELTARVAIREIFAIVERVSDGEERVVAYSDEGYAVIYADGSVEGEGTVLRDVKPTVALCSMDSYDLMDPPEDGTLPEPREVVEGSGEFGNLMLQVVAGVQVVVGLVLLGAWLALPSLSTVVAPIAAIGFLLIGLFLFLVVANARLSDRFRVEEFRNRLRALEGADEQWEDVLPEDVSNSIDGGDAADERPEVEANGRRTDPDESGAAGSDATSGSGP
jgi:hypothetical protein